MSYDGLQKTEIKGIELAYVRPGATLAGYHSIELAPVFVAFSKNWNPHGAWRSLETQPQPAKDHPDADLQDGSRLLRQAT